MKIKMIEDKVTVKSIMLTVSPEEYIVISSALKQFAENPNNIGVDIMLAKQMRIDICNRAESEEVENDKEAWFDPIIDLIYDYLDILDEVEENEDGDDTK